MSAPIKISNEFKKNMDTKSQSTKSIIYIK